MTNNKEIREFRGIRSNLYKESLKQFPDARDEERALVEKYLKPKKGEIILEVGAGSGFFSGVIADAVGPLGKLFVSDSSEEQLEGVKELGKKNVEIVQAGAGELPIREQYFDAIWSGGSLHHVGNKTEAFQNFAKILKKNGRLVISDVFVGSKLAKHFDYNVAKYCITGHEVSFLSEEFTDSLCYLVGLQKPIFYYENVHWKFRSKEDIGIFLYKIHAMVKTTPERCLKEAEEILGVEFKNKMYYLNWPLTIMISKNLKE